MTAHPSPADTGPLDVTRKDWVITCGDMIGRRRTCQVLADERGVVLIAPPGETAVLTTVETRKLRNALRDAAAEHRNGRDTTPND